MRQMIRRVRVLIDPGVLAVGVGAGVVLLVPQRQEIDVLARFGQDLRPLRRLRKRLRPEDRHQRIVARVQADVLRLLK